MKMTINKIILLVIASLCFYPIVEMYWEYIWHLMLYFTFITNVAMWAITLRVYIFQQQLKDNMNIPFFKKLFGRGKK